MTDDELVWIEIGKATDHVAKFSFWQKGKPPLSEPSYRRCDIKNCTAYLTNYHVLSNRVKYEGLVVWKPVPEEIPPTAPDKLRIARFISELPNQTFIADFKTLDQLYEWMHWKSECIWIAKCFLAGVCYPDDPLLKPLEEGQIDNFYHDFLWLGVKRYENLWSLLSIKSRPIKAAFKQQGWEFESPRHVMEKIIAADIDGEFSNVLKHRYVNRASEQKEIGRLARIKFRDSLTEQEKQHLSELIKKHSQPNMWLEKLLSVCDSLAVKDFFIRSALITNAGVMHSIGAKLEKAGRDPELKQYAHSYTWHEGVKSLGIKPTWTT